MPKPIQTVPLDHSRRSDDDMRRVATAFRDTMRRRRSVRGFSSEPIPLDAVEACVEAAAQAPSGANKQPWTFVLISDPAVKRQIRLAAEEEERAFYGERAPQRWLDDLAELGTDADKSFLETAPVLIAVFAQRHGQAADERHYYVNESVGIAVGFLIAGLHQAGFATLTHTPSPMKFLAQVLGRPNNERAYVLIPVGHPAPDCRVPAIGRKALNEYLVRK